MDSNTKILLVVAIIGIVSTVITAVGAIISSVSAIIGLKTTIKTSKQAELADVREIKAIERLMHDEVNLMGSTKEQLLEYFAPHAHLTIQAVPEQNIVAEDYLGIDRIMVYYDKFGKPRFGQTKYRRVENSFNVSLSINGQYAFATTMTQKRTFNNPWEYCFYQAWKLGKTPEKSWLILEFHGGLSRSEAEAMKTDMGRRAL